MSGQGEGTGEARLQKTFNTVEMFQDQLVASIQLDSWFPVDAFCVEFCTKPALWSCAVAARFPGPAYFALHLLAGNGHEKARCNTAIVARRRG